MRGFITIVTLIFCFNGAMGQSFEGEAAIPKVDVDAFYRILISPPVSEHLNDDLSDLRIYDANQREVPYLLEKEVPASHAEKFIEYEIAGKEVKTRCCTSLILRNARRTPINNINLIIKNAEAWREASLMGSDDKKNWFAIRDHFTLSAPENSDETQQMKILGFPWSNYEYYLLEIRDSIYAPLNILKAGYYEEQVTDGKYTELPVIKTAYDSATQKKTYVKLMMDGLHFVDRIEIVVSGAKYYRRNATIFEKRIRILKNGKRTTYFKPIQYFELTSGRTALIALVNVRAQEFLIEVDNQDNPPLEFSAVKALQLNQYLTALLSKGKSYTLRFGQPKLHAPIYDLRFFRDSIPGEVKVLQLTETKILKKTEAEISDTFFTSKSFIWAAIVVVMVVLGFMSVKMAREASQSEVKK